MKRLLCLLSVLCLLLGMSACNKEEPPTVTTEPPAESSTEPSSDATVPTDTTAEPSTPTASEPQESYREGSTSARAYRDADGHIWAMGMVEIVNSGDEPLLLDYSTFKFTDGKNHPIMAADSIAAFPQIIRPGESGYYFEVVEPDLADEDSLQVALQPNILPAAQEVIRYEVSETQFADTPYGGLTVSGKVTNPTDTAGSMVCVAAILKAADGSPLGVIYTYLTEALAAHATVDFSMDSFMLPPELKAADVAEIQYYAYPLQL